MRVLLAGLGSIGQRHARSLRRLLGDSVELLAFRQTNRDVEITDDLEARHSRDLAAVYGIEAYFDLEEALAQKPDATLVCTPNHLHVPIALAAARAGSHLFIEKPVSHDLEGLEELREEVRRRDLTCLVGYQLRFHPALERLGSLYREGAFGTVVSGLFDFGEHMPYWHRYEDYAESFMARADQGGGVVKTQIHDLDAIYGIFGIPESVYAAGGLTGALRMDAPDHVEAILRYRSPAADFSVVLTQDCLRYPPVRRYAIRGTRARAEWDYHANVLTFTEFDREPRTLYADGSFQRNTLFLREMQHFLKCVVEREAPIASLDEGIDSLRIALSIEESMNTGRPVPIREIWGQ